MKLERDIQFKVTYPLYTYRNEDGSLVNGCHSGSREFSTLQEATDFIVSIDDVRRTFTYLHESYCAEIDWRQL